MMELIVMKEIKKVGANLWFCGTNTDFEKILKTTIIVVEKFFKTPYVVFSDTTEEIVDLPFSETSISMVRDKLSLGRFNYIVYDRARRSNDAVFSVVLGTSKSVDEIVDCEMFNLISLEIGTMQLQTEPATEQLFLSVVKSMIEQYDPVFAAVDDTVVASDMLRRAHELTCRPFERIQTVYWGNYYGKEYCAKYSYQKLFHIPCFQSESLANGVWIQVSDSLLRTSWRETSKGRKIVAKALSIYLHDSAKRDQIHELLFFKG